MRYCINGKTAHSQYTLLSVLSSTIVPSIHSIMTGLDQSVFLCCGHYYTVKVLIISDSVDGRVKESSILLFEDGTLLTKSTFLICSKTRQVNIVTMPSTINNKTGIKCPTRGYSTLRIYYPPDRIYYPLDKVYGG